MQLEQMGIGETQGLSNFSEKDLIYMVLKRLERIENKIDQKIDDAIKARLGLGREG